MRNLFAQNFMENGINNPLLYFPIFYSVQESINGGDWRNGVKIYSKNWKDDGRYT
jgi:hypothetical protein